MSADAIAAAVVTLVAAVSGIENVYQEEPLTLDRQQSGATRFAGGRVHFWHVKVAPTDVLGGIGYNELHWRVTVEGFLGMARDEPYDGVSSDKTARKLLSAVRAKLSSPLNITLSGNALGSERVVCEPIRLTKISIDRQVHPVHRVAVSYLVMEDA